MKHCSRHLHELSDALRKKNLWRLVQPERATELAGKWLAGHSRPDEFDPMVVSVLEINAKASQLCYGLSWAGSECPLCKVESVLQNSNAGEMWIDNVTDLMVVTAQVNGLMPGSAGAH